MKCFKRTVSLVIGAVIFCTALCGCAEKEVSAIPDHTVGHSESGTQPVIIETAPVTTTTEPVTTAAPETTTAPTTTAEPTTTPAPETSAYVENDESDRVAYHSRSDEYNAFIDRTVFVGDSICRGLEAYRILDEDQVIATGNVSANNIFSFTFDYAGSEMSFLDALDAIQPECVVFSMGMNDVNMTSAEKFCENYGVILDRAREILPDAMLVVASVTPITADNSFSTNDKIDSYNAQMREYLKDRENCYFADIAPGIKNNNNALKKDCNGGDGIHLSPDAYNEILYELCVIFVDGGIYVPNAETETVVAEETTAPEVLETPESETQAVTEPPIE